MMCITAGNSGATHGIPMRTPGASPSATPDSLEEAPALKELQSVGETDI